MLGVLDDSELEKVLSRTIIGRVGCHADDTTYVVPMSYAFDGTYIYGHANEGMKVRMMRKNPSVCFQVDDMQDMANWKSVIVWGEFEELIEKAERDKALQILIDRILPLNSSETTHLSPHWPFPVSDLSLVKGIVFRIRIRKKTGRFEKYSNLTQSL
jgi:nitroimidazol reductase NimA-like FMN-containing flavoprotein (pyridoxamine 5'-phosphate oxidase superfamily)